MRKRSILKEFTSWTAIAAFAQPAAFIAAATIAVAPAAHAAPVPHAAQPSLSVAKEIALLRQHVKYVFVIFQENESFDHYFGTFPGANGLYQAPGGATPANQTPSFVQTYLDTNLNTVTQTPFLMPQSVVTTQAGNAGPAGTVVAVYPADLISVDHGHQGMANDMDFVNGVTQNDHYAMNQEVLTTNAMGQIVTGAGAAPTTISLPAKQKAETDLSHYDCDTIPFLWAWAKNFVLFDNFHQTIVGPSTPNAIAMIAGQSGQTQFALHPNQGATVTYANPNFQNVRGASYGSMSGQSNAYVPVVADPGPWPGSNNDSSPVKPPYNFDESASNTSYNLTFASLPLSFMGSSINSMITHDQNPAADLLDVQDDITQIASFNAPVPWGWYQQGFDGNDAPDPFEPQGTGTPNPLLYTGYVLHHNGPQYFGYLADNTYVLGNNLHGAADFITDVNNRTLAPGGGVYYVRGGYDNNDNLVPLDPTAAVQHAFIGNDDHPAYSDAQISEAFAAKAINAIVNSPYWSQSAIIISYDETDGFYDHAPVNVRNTFVDGSPLAAGPRIPTIVISPWAAAGTISHNYSEHSSIIKLIDTLFGLTPLADLPDEVKGAQMAQTNLGQSAYGPADDPNNDVGNMLEAFDYGRMKANRPISGAKAMFSMKAITTLPHLALANPVSNPAGYSPNGYTNGACAKVGVLPTDFSSWAAYQAGTPSDPYPVDVNPRPTTSTGIPTSGNWTP
jgi:phospholipase C